MNSEHIPNGQVDELIRKVRDEIQRSADILRPAELAMSVEAVIALHVQQSTLTRRSSAGVRGLEWLSDAPPFSACTPFCYYRIEHADDDTGPHWQTTIHYTGSTYRRHETEAEAKAAAQADFNTRILSALSSPAHIGEDEPVAWLEHAQRAYDILVSDPPGPFTARECRASYALTYIPGLNLRPSPSVPPQGETSLDERMAAAGMIPLSVLLSGETPLKDWTAHAAVRDLGTFRQWLEMRYRELLTMRVGYELGDKDKTDELYEWVLGNVGAFSEVMANFRQAGLLTPSPTLEPTDAEVERALVVEALRALVLLKDLFDASDRNQADAYYILAKQDGTWGNARSALNAIASRQPTSGEGV